MMGLVKQKSIPPPRRGKLKAQPDCAQLASDLESAEAGARRQAARNILRCPEAAVRLIDRLNREQEVAVREAILNALIRLNDASAAAGLIDCLRSEDAALRNNAMEAFRQLGEHVLPLLQSLLSDPAPDVRICAVNILGSQSHAGAEKWLIRVIEEDSHVNVCATAVDLLCEIGTEAASDSLLRLKTRFAHDPYIQFAADLAINRIREI